MKWFKNIKIGIKLVFGFSVMILLMGIIGFTGYRSVNNIEFHLTDIFNIRLPSIDCLIEADRDFQQLLVSERSMIFADPKSDLFKELVEAYETNLTQSDKRWDRYKKLAATQEEAEIIPKYERARNEWKAISKKVVDGRIADTRQGRRESLDLTLGLAKNKFEEMSAMTQQNADNAQQADKLMKEANLVVGQANDSMDDLTKSMSVIRVGPDPGQIPAAGYQSTAGDGHGAWKPCGISCPCNLYYSVF